jgi:uncharacterized coiled-coil DUF342 family protein
MYEARINMYEARISNQVEIINELRGERDVLMQLINELRGERDVLMQLNRSLAQDLAQSRANYQHQQAELNTARVHICDMRKIGIAPVERILVDLANILREGGY